MPAPDRRRTVVGSALLVTVLVVALVIGSGLGGSRPSLSQRARALESQVKCPSCEDLSVAQSSTTASVAVRHEITQMLAAGRSDQQVETALVAQYGPSILLRPPASGLTAVVWVVPVALAIVTSVALGALFWRRSRQFTALGQDPPGGLATGPGEPGPGMSGNPGGTRASS